MTQTADALITNTPYRNQTYAPSAACVVMYRMYDSVYRVFRSSLLDDLDISGQDIDILQGVDSRNACRIFFDGEDVLIDALDLYHVVFQLQPRMIQSDMDMDLRRDGIQVTHLFLNHIKLCHYYFLQK